MKCRMIHIGLGGLVVVGALTLAVFSSIYMGTSEEGGSVGISRYQVPTVMEQAVAGPGVGANHTDGVSIYISKMFKTVTLEKYGAEIGCYPASLGENSGSGDKEREGDRKTPSGKFYVCTKNDKSSYYLSLGLSYPDIADADRGFEAGIITQEERDAIYKAIKAGEQPPWNTALGGAIMIHGDRSPGGVTAGCIAVDNEVMDILWEYCQNGVSVTIGP